MNTVQNYTKTMQERGEWNLQHGSVGPNLGMAERLASGVGGAILLGNALLRPSVATLVGGLLGVGLVTRGVTASCPIYRAMGRSTAPTAAKDHGLHETPSQVESRVDDTLDDSFPASDPPSNW